MIGVAAVGRRMQPVLVKSEQSRPADGFDIRQRSARPLTIQVIEHVDQWKKSHV